MPFDDDIKDALASIRRDSAMLENMLLKHLLNHEGSPVVDRRWLSIAKTHFEQGFMAHNRALGHPQN